MDKIHSAHGGQASIGLFGLPGSALAAGRFGMKLETFILAALHGELTVETLPIPPRQLARTQAQARLALASFAERHAKTLYDQQAPDYDKYAFEAEVERTFTRRLFEQIDESTLAVIHVYVAFARLVNDQLNESLDGLTDAQRRHHDWYLRHSEANYVRFRAAFEAAKGRLTQLEQQIVERLVEVKFTR